MASGLRARSWPVSLIAGAGRPQDHGGRFSYVACDPDRQLVVDRADDVFGALEQPDWAGAPAVGLLSYDAGARQATGERDAVWPDLVLGRYPAWLAFDHRLSRVEACGWGADTAEAEAQAKRAEGWLALLCRAAAPPAPSLDFTGCRARSDYRAAVAAVVDRIGQGELFQANIAREWCGTLKAGADPYDVFLRLAGQRGAAYSACWVADGHALVSNSPELFLTYSPRLRRLEARPIKGTRPRGDTPQEDLALARELEASAKDRAENLMIVDLMRNDLSRVCEAGTVVVEQLCGLESFATVHHLTSVVSGRVKDGVDWPDILRKTFPAGSITGAPKHRAMQVIADFEAPRGAWCGTLFVQGMAADDTVTASVLIRSASFRLTDRQWHWRAMAGAGITADSQPAEELAETDAKIRALRDALYL